MKSLLPVILAFLTSPLAAQTLINGRAINPATSITVTSYTATATGSSQFSIQAASGIKVNAGGVNAPFVQATHYGDASHVTGMTQDQIAGLVARLISLETSSGTLQAISVQLDISTQSLYNMLASTGSALTLEISRAIQRENGIGVSTGTLYAALASTGSALTQEIARAIQRETDLGVSSGTIFAALNSTASALTQEIARAIVRENELGVSSGTIYAALNSTASALTNEIARAIARETALGVSSGTIYAALNSTASALTQEIARAILRETDLGVSSGTIYAALNSTASALTNEMARAVAAEALLLEKSGGTMTGQLTISGSSETITGQGLDGNSLQTSSGIYTPNGTVNAKLFVGNGSGLTNIPGIPSSGINTFYTKWTGASTLSPSQFMSEVSTGVSVSTGIQVNGGISISGNIKLSTASVIVSSVPGAGWFYVTCNATAGSVSFTLPDLSSSIGRAFNFKKIDSTGNWCTLTAAGSDTIDGSVTQSIGTQYKSLSIWAGADEWHIY